MKESDDARKGFGLFAAQDLEKGESTIIIFIQTQRSIIAIGQFLHEYFGEILSAKDLNERMKAYVKKKHLYVMQVRMTLSLSMRPMLILGALSLHSSPAKQQLLLLVEDWHLP